MTGDDLVYLDHAATTPVAAQVLEAMLPHLGEVYGNPSSAHAAGRRARSAVDEARDRVAAAVGCAPAEVVFTSGGSEADNLALRGTADRSPGAHVVVTAIEHDAVIRCAELLAEQGRIRLSVAGCDSRGVVDPEEVAALVEPDTRLVSVMLANNEVGTIQDVAAVAELVKRRNPRTLVHTDAVQALGKLPIDLAAIGADLLTITAHKAYGPKGAGALIVRRGVALAPLVAGGGQERGRRSGTENVAGIVGFGAAVTLAEAEREPETGRLLELSSRLLDRVATGVPDAVLTARDAPRLPSFATFAFPGVESQVLITLLDRLGVAGSGGSACSSGAQMPSHVLAAMGLPPAVAGGALRLTLGRGTTGAEVETAAERVVEAVSRVRSAVGAAW